MVIDIYYKKNRNKNLFADLEKYNFSDLQNYIPIYNNFFELNESNWNSINLNNKNTISSIHSKKEGIYEIYNIYNQNKKIKSVFAKLSPILDPIKYMCGKYKDLSDNSICELPHFNKEVNFKKDNVNNVSYVDGFFYYLSSKLLHDYNFYNGTDYFGSYLGNKKDFQINIFDDIEYLQENPYFLENINKLFKIDDTLQIDIMNFDTRKNKNRIEMDKSIDTISVNSLNEMKEFNCIFQNSNENLERNREKNEETNQEINVGNDNLYEMIDSDFISKNKKNSNYIENLERNREKKQNIIDGDIDNKNECDIDDKSSITTCSSRTSRTSNSSTTSKVNTNIINNKYDISINEETISINSFTNLDDVLERNREKEQKNKENKEDSIENNEYKTLSETYDTLSTISDEYLCATINKFPVQLIFIENLKHTLDYYIDNFEIDDNEWSSILFQVIMMLITYQKVFDFTHNDLHTNNIMYYETDMPYLYYSFKNKYYKVPTYGKIYKIIDFGRAIYKFKGKLMCSDSYYVGEDAHTQYNFGPCYNNKKPLIEPNKSFDLCRLAVSLYDYFFESVDEEKEIKKNSVEELISQWIKDDNGRNILYKTNGKERYPGFKLYKMIARNAHNHLPENQLNHYLFKKFLIQRKKIRNKNNEIFNIDKLPVMV